MTAVRQFDYITGAVRPTWRGALHVFGLVGWIPASFFLLRHASSATEWTALTIYSVSVLAVFAVSAAYHRLARTEPQQLRMSKLDHSMIFVQIAGTYTPVCLLALPTSWGISLLVVVWSLAVVGIAMKLFGNRTLWYAANGMYGVVGCVAFVGLPVVYNSLSSEAFVALLVGGVAYGIGALIFWRRYGNWFPLTFGYHEYWHLFTIIGAVAHYVTILQIVS